MSTKNTIVSLEKSREYDRPPTILAEDRRPFFELPANAKPYYRKLRTSVSQLNFLLQYGYFRARHRFYEPDKYPTKDIQFLIRHHRLTDLMKDLDRKGVQHLRANMVGATSTRHRQEIMRLEGFMSFDNEAEERLRTRAQHCANRLMGKGDALDVLIAYCREQAIELPAFDTLSNLVRDSFRQQEERLISIVAQKMTPQNKLALKSLLDLGSQRSTLLTEAKSIDQSVTARSLTKNAKRLAQLKRLYLANLPVIEQLQHLRCGFSVLRQVGN